jgi:hypothetical protein
MELHVLLVQSQYMPLDPSTRRTFAIAISDPQIRQGFAMALPFFADAIFAGFFVAIFQSPRGTPLIYIARTGFEPVLPP